MASVRLQAPGNWAILAVQRVFMLPTISYLLAKPGLILIHSFELFGAVTGRLPVDWIVGGSSLNRRSFILAGVVLALSTGLVAADSMIRPFKVANSCVAQCRAAHSQCRIATKGSPGCDRKLQACLRRCLNR